MSGYVGLLNGGPNGNRTRVSGVRGQRPRPLDDGTATKLIADSGQLIAFFKVWLGEEDSNPRKPVQSLSSYHWTIPQLRSCTIYKTRGSVKAKKPLNSAESMAWAFFTASRRNTLS